MEFVAAILTTSIGLLKDMWSSTSKFFDNQRTLDQNLVSLQEKMERLKSREHDLKIELENTQYNRKKVSNEVVNWMIEVQNMKDHMERLEKQVKKRRYFSRLEFLREVEGNIEKANKLSEEGSFSQGILIDVKDEGIKLSTEELIGTITWGNLGKIRACFEEGEVHNIGIWGIGGVGKTTLVTHVHSLPFRNEDTFGPVYWVTVSKDSAIDQLQDAIAGKINLDLSKEKDQKIRASLLSEALGREKKFVLILDDLWEVYRPEDVGIPIGADAGRLIITSRSRDLCVQMGCQEIIEVQPLHEEEALELFRKWLKRQSPLSPKEEEIAHDIVKECAGLPLAIVIIARSLCDANDIAEWRNALKELREHVTGHTIAMETTVHKILEFSYNRLNDDKIRECLLYCALFPEDFEIRRMSLIRCWIAEGLIEEMKSRHEERDRGHIILNKLENLRLLERCRNGKAVKMHDVIREMAINVTRKNSRFMVKTDGNLEDLSGEMVCSDNLERVSLLNGQLSSSMFEPNCPKLSTLFLQSYKYRLYRQHEDGLPNSFFVHTINLRVLDLSGTSIPSLPDSLYDLVDLRALILCDCRKLKHVGSLAKLKELRVLDFSKTEIETIPDGIEKLVHLKQFSWISMNNSRQIRDPLPMIFSNLVRLERLDFKDSSVTDVEAEELVRLTRLEILCIRFSNIHNFNSYMRALHYRRLTHYQVQLIPGTFPYLGQWRSIERFCKEVRVVDCTSKEERKVNNDCQLVLPTNLQALHMEGCRLPNCLLNVSPSSFKNMKDLEACSIVRCEGMEYVWWIEDCIASLNTLFLFYLASLRVLFKFRTADIERSCCSNLKYLEVIGCDNLKHLFTPALVKYHLQSLQTIIVKECNGMEDIIVAAEGEEDNVNEIMDNPISFPKLERLALISLGRLKSIWKGTMACDSLQLLAVKGCPKLTRLPILVHVVGKMYGDVVWAEEPPLQLWAEEPPLQQFYGDEEWWEKVVWDTSPYAKSLFKPEFYHYPTFDFSKFSEFLHHSLAGIIAISDCFSGKHLTAAKKTPMSENLTDRYDFQDVEEAEMDRL